MELDAQDASLSASVYQALGTTFTLGGVGALAYAARTSDLNPWAGLALGAGI